MFNAFRYVWCGLHGVVACANLVLANWPGLPVELRLLFMAKASLFVVLGTAAWYVLGDLRHRWFWPMR